MDVDLDKAVRFFRDLSEDADDIYGAFLYGFLLEERVLNMATLEAIMSKIEPSEEPNESDEIRKRMLSVLCLHKNAMFLSEISYAAITEVEDEHGCFCHYDDMIAATRNAMEYDPDSISALLAAGVVCLFPFNPECDEHIRSAEETQDVNNALEYLRKFLTKASSDHPLYAEVFEYVAHCYMLLDDCDNALKFYKQAIYTEAAHAESYIVKGKTPVRDNLEQSFGEVTLGSACDECNSKVAADLSFCACQGACYCSEECKLNHADIHSPSCST